jgi:hypothetical protein
MAVVCAGPVDPMKNIRLYGGVTVPRQAALVGAQRFSGFGYGGRAYLFMDPRPWEEVQPELGSAGWRRMEWQDPEFGESDLRLFAGAGLEPAGKVIAVYHTGEIPPPAHADEQEWSASWRAIVTDRAVYLVHEWGH